MSERSEGHERMREAATMTRTAREPCHASIRSDGKVRAAAAVAEAARELS